MVDMVAKDGPIVLVASSNGGWISTYLATVRPNRIRGMVLIGEKGIFVIYLIKRVLEIENGFSSGPAFNYPSEFMRILQDGGDFTKDIMEELKTGKVIRHETPYGEGYYSLDGLKKSMQFEVPFEEGIKVMH